jgi:hypothetical protein
MKKNWFFNLGESKASQVFLLQIPLLLLSIFLIFNFQTDFKGNPNKQTPRMTLKVDVLQHSILGYTMFMADMMWIRVIQEIDYMKHQFENRGWVFRFLDAITTLDRRYKTVYRDGVVVLSVIIRDAEGAAYLYERGIKNYPNDWTIAYRAGYHYLHEVKNCKRAAELLNSAADHGAPGWIHALAGRLFAKSGQYALARSVLESGLKDAEGTNVAQEFRARLQQLDDAYHDPNKKTLIEGLECEAPKN